MDGKRSRRRLLEDDMPANPREVGEFLAAFGRQPAKPPAAVKPKAPRAKAPAARKPQVRNLKERIWLQQVWAGEKENRRRERAGLPPVACTKIWDEIRDGESAKSRP